jgi:hypothetical protein
MDCRGSACRCAGRAAALNRITVPGHQGRPWKGAGRSAAFSWERRSTAGPACPAGSAGGEQCSPKSPLRSTAGPAWPAGSAGGEQCSPKSPLRSTAGPAWPAGSAGGEQCSPKSPLRSTAGPAWPAGSAGGEQCSPKSPLRPRRYSHVAIRTPIGDHRGTGRGGDAAHADQAPTVRVPGTPHGRRLPERDRYCPSTFCTSGCCTRRSAEMA